MSTTPLPTKLRTSSSINKKYIQVLDLLERANRDQSLYTKDQKLVVALSGGADSVALITLLKRQEKKYHLKLFAAHLDHGFHHLSAHQSRFCESYCKQLGIPFYTKKIHLALAAKKQKRSIEEAGRIERYRFFSDVCAKTGARHVATAHNMNDQAETVLMRLFRGTGFRGLVAIPWKRRERGFTLIRPMLYCEKSNIISWLKSEKIRFCDDPTNQDQLLTRNFIRLTLIPLLEKRLNPQTKRALVDFQSAFQEGFDFIEASASKLAALYVRKKGNAVFVRNVSRKHPHPAVADEMLRIAMSRLKGDYLGVGFDHIRQMRNLYLGKERIGKKLHLPGQWIVEKRSSGLKISASHLR